MKNEKYRKVKLIQTIFLLSLLNVRKEYILFENMPGKTLFIIYHYICVTVF